MAVRISHPDHPQALRTLVVVLAIATMAVFVPLWAPLVLAAWVGHLTRPLLIRLEQRLGRSRRATPGRRRRAAGALVLLLLLALLGPLVLLTVALVSSAIDLLQRALQSASGEGALRTFLGGESTGIELSRLWSTPAKLVSLVREYGSRAWTALDAVAGMTAKIVIGLFVFVLGTYTTLVEGDDALGWARRYAPLRPEHFDRLVAAFHETGRGLLIGIALTGVVQSVVATIAYLILGVPSALVLGMLTFFGSLIPSVGTGLVWAPVALGLALSGRTTAAIAMVAIGLGVISVIDNVVRPIFARYGRLDLPAFVVLIAMFGALALLDAWGLVLGPLLCRLFVETLRIAREQRLTGAHLGRVDSR